MTKPLILCIDDEKSILDSLESQLQAEFGLEFAIELAENAEEAQEVIEEYLKMEIDIPLILADYLMPGCKGDQFLIWAHAKTPETRKILLTGQAGMDAVIHTINHAALYRYISKPWERNDLILTVKEAVESFNHQKMIRLQNLELKSLNSQLQQINKELDERVSQRTLELNQQKIMFQQVFDNSPDAMAIVDEFEKIIQVNPAFETMFQYKVSEVKGYSLSELIVNQDLIEESTELRAGIMSGKTMHLETQRHNRHSKSIPVSLTSYPLDINPVSRRAIVVYQDLTFKRETADLLQRTYARQRRNDFFNVLATTQKKIDKDIYAQGQLLGIPLKSSFSMLFLSITQWTDPFETDNPDRETGLQIFIDKIIDQLSQKPQLYAWDSRTGIGILHLMPPDYSCDIKFEKQLAENLQHQMSNDFPEGNFVIGIAEFWPQMEHFAERFKEARISALIGERLHPSQSIHHYLEIGAFPLLSKLTDDEESRRFLGRTLGKILEYDATNGTSLFETLEKIVAYDNLRKVAGEMFLHYKTIIFRKQSIEKILGVSLDTFEGRTLVGTAMALYYFYQMEEKP
jgi:PAS domain S-box-containing protein